jgi:Raf kinase inhibitor-like YbhB/YbcL family protein
MKVRPGIARLVEIRHVYVLIVFAASGCGRGSAPLPSSPPGLPALKLTSPAFTEGGTIPKVFTCDGADKSPPLQWSGVPKAARSLVLICDDPDAPAGTWSHWVVFNLPPEVTSLEEGVAAELTAAPEPQPVVKQAIRSTIMISARSVMVVRARRAEPIVMFSGFMPLIAASMFTRGQPALKCSEPSKGTSLPKAN